MSCANIKHTKKSIFIIHTIPNCKLAPRAVPQRKINEQFLNNISNAHSFFFHAHRNPPRMLLGVMNMGVELHVNKGKTPSFKDP